MAETTFDDFEPVYQVDEDRPLLLYVGTGRVDDGDGAPIVGAGTVTFDLRPSPAYCFAVDTTGYFSMRSPTVSIDLPVAPEPPPDALPEPTTGQRTTERTAQVVPIGTLTSADLVRLHVVNLQKLTQVGSVVLATSPDLTITISEPSQTATDRLAARGGFAVTHMIDVKAHRPGVLTGELVDELVTELADFLAFITGSRPGIGLAVGLNGEAPVWTWWAITHTDRWRNTLTWYSPTLHGELQGLWSAWRERTRDPFWRETLPRVARILAAANGLDLVETAVFNAQSALEILYWAIDPTGAASRGNAPEAKVQVRELLAWAGAPNDLPSEYVDLAKKIDGDPKNLEDGPAAAAWVRNRLTHPPKGRDPVWPKRGLLIETWRLTMDHAELVVLKLLDYSGRWGTRRHLEGRPPWATEPVPWAAAHDAA